ncbi:kinase-associated lipoprotein B [Bacillus salitolerans]|uniref:Kinase-associated lipoprotein B n=1 Tax=Bacillus salitolerans TaxID=1437434 RepID=A0ABW4LMT3_9BACI
MNESLQIGDTVKAPYKTGVYIGEITNIRPEHYLVKVLSVLKHPTQGDLHSHKSVDVPIFHERRALAEREQTNIPKQMVKRFDGEVPGYKESLKGAIDKLRQELESEKSDWSRMSIEKLNILEKDYFKE